MEIKVLTTRNVDCSTLTAEEFAKLMIKDMTNARTVYHNIWYPIELERHNNYIQTRLKCIKVTAQAFAEKKWKTEKRRNEYVANEVAKFKATELRFHNISFFDFKVTPGSNGISSNCILQYSDLTTEAMIRCFNEIKDNKYFLAAKGWELEDHHGFRPQVKLILDEDMENMYKDEEESLCRAIENFYSGSNYWGD